MEKQNQIKRTLKQPEALKQICSMLEANENIKRVELADQLCGHFGFFDLRGEKQRGGCLKALRELEQKKYFILPKSTRKLGSIKPRRLSEPVPEAQNVPHQADEICNLELIVVATEEHMRIWNEMMIQDHPQGAGPLVGRQIRYLARSEHGWLGGFGFSSCALHLEARDKWIGWNLEERRAGLHYVVNMSRFLIRASVSCKNLASRLLGMCVQSFPQDFKNRYGYSPVLLESFVDTSNFQGTCYRAANWQRIGRTKGRGRQDRLMEKAKTVKDIYVYPLEKDFRLKMELPNDIGLQTLEPAEGTDNENWAENEFGSAPLGDKRLSRRLVASASRKALDPRRAYSGITGGEWADVKGYYRLIDSPDESAVTMANILLPHRERTIRRMKAQKIVLCIQDGSDLNYSKLDKCDGLGIIGSNQTGAQSRGLHLHSTLAVTTSGLPLGVLRAECTAPLPKSNSEKKEHSSRAPIEEKKTFAWIKGLRDCMEVKAQIPSTTLVSVLDREADFFELFDEQRRNCSKVPLLVRAKCDRQTSGEHKLFETARQSPVQAQVNIQIPRQSARSKKYKQKARAKRPTRKATVSVRYISVKLNPPSYLKDKEPIPVWVVHVYENNPPADTEPLEWFLLTTIDIKSVDDALNCVKWYCRRWRIEDWHRVLKSGCGVEELAHKTAERLRRAIAINMVIAWRIMLMTLLGRETPKLPSDVLFSEIELEVLTSFAKKKDFPLPLI